jgi:hypothetical protein
LTKFRRFLVFFLLSFSFGGFLFYAGVVVPIGTSVLGSTTQGFVTRLVTKAINGSTALTVMAIIWDYVAERNRRGRLEKGMLFTCTCAIAVCSLSLFALHSRLDMLLDPARMDVLDSKTFYRLHRIYLWTSTIQWLCSLPVLWILVNSPAVDAHAHGSRSIEF